MAYDYNCIYGDYILGVDSVCLTGRSNLDPTASCLDGLCFDTGGNSYDYEQYAYIDRHVYVAWDTVRFLDFEATRGH